MIEVEASSIAIDVPEDVPKVVGKLNSVTKSV